MPVSLYVHDLKTMIKLDAQDFDLSVTL